MEKKVQRRLLLTGVGGALASTGLARAQTNGTSPPSQPDPWFDARAFGAVGDGATDDTGAIQAALSTAGSGNYPLMGGSVFLPRGTYLISATLNIPDRVSLVGVGRDATTIKAFSHFPTGTPLIQLGVPCPPQGSCASRIENLTVDCNGVSGSTGIYANTINEQSGVFRTLVQQFGAYGIRIDVPSGGQGWPQHWTIEEAEISAGPVTPAWAVALAVTLHTNSMPIRYISRVSVGSFFTPLTNAITLDGIGPGRISDVHVEGAVNGILVGSKARCWGLVFMNIDGMSNVTNLMVWATQSSPQQALTAIALNPDGGVNTLVNQINGNILTGPVAFYAMGNGGGNDNTVLSADYNVPTRLRRLHMMGGLSRSVVTPSYTPSYTPDLMYGGEVVEVALQGNIFVASPVNAEPGQKLLFVWMQNPQGGCNVAYDYNYLTSGAAPINTSPGTTTLDQFVCLANPQNGQLYWRLYNRITGQR